MGIQVVPDWMAELEEEDVAFLKTFLLCSVSGSRPFPSWLLLFCISIIKLCRRPINSSYKAVA